MLNQETIAAISTPPGVGGIAIIRISGENARKIAAKVFSPKGNKDVEKIPGYTALYGEFQGKNGIIDEGIALAFTAPHSYTGEEVVELYCHGGEIVSREVLRACFNAGALPAERGEFTKRAVLNNKMDLSQAEAVMDLISATNAQSAAMAQANLKGALQADVEEQKQTLLQLMAHILAAIDFPEEDIDDAEDGEWLQTVQTVKGNLTQLLNRYDKGMAVKRGVKTVIVGSPNVGKSTLFNLMAGYERAIVTPTAGTTRDTISEDIHIGGTVIQLADTAGIHKTTDTIEKEGIKRSIQQIDEAGLVVVVFDGSRKLSEKDHDVIQYSKDKRSLAIINKVDKEQKIEKDVVLNSFDSVVEISAKDSASYAIIDEAIQERLKIQDFDVSAGVLANERQYAMALKAKKALEEAENAILSGVTIDAVSVCIEEALYALGTLTGDNVSEAILDEVFDTFCIGK